MPPAALVLVLGAAVFHSAWNLVLKSEPRRLEASLLALGAAVVLCAPALWIHPLAAVPARGWALVALSGLFETLYLVVLTKAYEAGDLSLVYPVARGMAPLVVTPFATLGLGERLSAPGLCGIALVVAGIFTTLEWRRRGSRTVAGGASSSSAPGSPPTAIIFAVLTGVTIAGYSLVNTLGVRVVPVALYAFLVLLLDACLLGVVLRLRGGFAWPRPGAARWRAAAIGALMLGAYLAILTALSIAPVSYVVAGREVSIVVTALAGALVLHERHSSRRVAAAAVIFAGVVVLALSR